MNSFQSLLCWALDESRMMSFQRNASKHNLCWTSVLLCLSVCVALFYQNDIRKSLRSRGFLRVGPRSTYQRNGSPTCHLTLFPWDGSSPCTLNTSLAIQIPSSSSSNGPTMTVTTVANWAQCPVNTAAMIESDLILSAVLTGHLAQLAADITVVSKVPSIGENNRTIGRPKVN